jgi:hypothetical protein
MHRRDSGSTLFLALQMYKHLNWKINIEQLVPKLSGTCNALRSMLHIGNTEQH